MTMTVSKRPLMIRACVLVVAVLGSGVFGVAADGWRGGRDDENNNDGFNFFPSLGSQVDFYKNACPAARGVIRLTVLSAIIRDRGLPAALLRLQFHDCFVRVSLAFIMECSVIVRISLINLCHS